ncbi:uncharacterized protein LOC143286502 [Babylonia areolata]|uniref:uncharacterized protein LOC143286502 n=1 Tax=Babylonia areolata TaxID=304850 RepID=UPI003FD27E8C
MASGFMSSVVHRLFHGGKGRDRNPRQDPTTTAARGKRHAQDDLTSSSSPTTPPPASSSSSSSPSSFVGRQHEESMAKYQEARPNAERSGKKRDQTKGKSALFSSLRKKTRPLSCVAARPDSPPTLLTEAADPQRSPGEPKTPSKKSNKGGKEDEERKSGSKQRREKKPRRPLSCIVQPPSPRLLPSVDDSPQSPRDTARGAASHQREGSAHMAIRVQPRPRPASCFVEVPRDRSPPPYCRRPTQGGSPQVPEPVDQFVPFQVGSPKRAPPSYLEAANRSPKPAPLSQQPLSLDERSPRAPLPYQMESSQQPVTSCAENPRSPRYPGQLQKPLPSSSENSQQSVPYSQQSLRQSTPVMDNNSSRPPDRFGMCGDANCFLNPCPYRPPAQPQSYGGYSYDLKTYFPPAPSARRYARPQSACFLCDPQPCCVEARRACRPRSQCYFPDCDFTWSGPNPAPNPDHQLQPTTLNYSPGVDRVLQADGPVSRPQLPSDPPVETGKSDSTTSPGEYSPRPPPRPAKRTLAPRPKSTCLLSTESEGSPMSSPAPSPRPRRFPLKKYRSADCLDRVDELESLELSPPPAKPLSYFTTTTTTDNPQQKTTTSNTNSSINKHDEIFTSAEMLEKLGQPRSSRKQPRPVSCFAGSSSGGTADESGYLSNATLGGSGSGWLGGLSISTGDILEMLDGEDLNADDEMSFERASSFRKAWSVCSLLRQDTIQDRSFTVMRRRRQKMKDRRLTNQRSSSTETDDGVVDMEKGGGASTSTSSLLGGGESATVAGIPLDGKSNASVPGSRGVVLRMHSAHMKAWQIRLRRKQMMKKKWRSAEKLGSRIETLV